MSKLFGRVSRRPAVMALALLLCAAASAQAQKGRDARVVSAQAGGVNYVSGSVSVKHKGETTWEALTTEQNLDSGDTARTAAYGRVEVLLNPGSYLRVGENSEFELADSSLDNLRIKMLKGSAVIEAKAEYRSAQDGVQQARDYAEVLGLRFAYASNGREIIEIALAAGTEVERADFPTPVELWDRQRRMQAGRPAKGPSTSPPSATR